MRYVNPTNYDCADDYWDAFDAECEREEAARQQADINGDGDE